MTKKEIQKLENQLVEKAYAKEPKIWIKVCREQLVKLYHEREQYCSDYEEQEDE